MNKVFRKMIVSSCLIPINILLLEASGDSTRFIKYMINNKVRCFNTLGKEQFPFKDYDPAFDIKNTDFVIVNNKDKKFGLYNLLTGLKCSCIFNRYSIQTSPLQVTLYNDTIKYTYFFKQNIGFYHHLDSIKSDVYTYSGFINSEVFIFDYTNRRIMEYSFDRQISLNHYHRNAILSYSNENKSEIDNIEIRNDYPFRKSVYDKLKNGCKGIIILSDSSLLLIFKKNIFFYDFKSENVQLDGFQYLEVISDSVVVLKGVGGLALYNVNAKSIIKLPYKGRKIITSTADSNFLFIVNKNRLIKIDALTGNKMQDYKKHESYLYSVMGYTITEFKGEYWLYSDKNKIQIDRGYKLVDIDFTQGIISFELNNQIIFFDCMGDNFVKISI